MAHNHDDNRRSQRDEIYSKRVPAGRRTYFFDAALDEAIDNICSNHLPGYDFRSLPEVELSYDEDDVCA